MGRPSGWSDVEMEILLDFTSVVKYHVVADALETRTTDQVRRKMQHLGIRTRPKGRTELTKKRRLEYNRQWKYNNRSRCAEIESERRSRTGQADYTREEIFDRDGWICQICFDEVPKWKLTRNHPLEPTIEHVIALRDGGPNLKSNVVLAHRRCNCKKKPMALKAKNKIRKKK